MAEKEKTYEFLNYSSEPFLVEETQEGSLIFANEAAAKILNIPRVELIGENLASHIKLFSMPGSASVWRRGSRIMEMEEYKLNGNSGLKLIKLSEIDPQVSDDDLTMLTRVSAVFRHRLHSPLNAVSGFFELLKENLDDHPHEIEAIEGGIENMSGILRSVKFFEELDEPEIKPSDAAAITDYVKDNFTKAELQHVSWNIEVARPLVTDHQMLTELITLLLQNGLDANEDNFQKVEVEIKHSSDIYLRVRNYGTVIPKKHLPMLFKPFFTTKAQNLGLGLTKAYLLTQKLGGFLYLRSNSKVDGICFEAVL